MKKILSLLLVCLMIVAILPSAFAAESDINNDAGNFWLFTSGSHGVDGTLTSVAKNSDGVYISKVTLDETVDYVSDRWALANQWYSSTYHPYDGSFKWTPSSKGVGTFSSSYNGLLFELVTDTAGTFNPELTYIQGPHGAIYEVFFFEKGNLDWGMLPDGTSVLSGNRADVYNYMTKHLENRIGIIDAYGATSKPVSKVFPEITVKANTSYYMFIVVNGNNPAWTASGEGKPVFDLVSLSLSDRKEVSERETLTYVINTYSFDLNTAKFMAQGSLAGQFYNPTAVTWKNVTKKYDAATASLVDCESYSLMHLDKTSPFAMENHTQNTTGAGNYPRFGVSGIDITMKTAAYTLAMAERPHLVIRINVPKAGSYALSTYNKTLDKGYNPNGSTTCSDYGVNAMVYFGKAPNKYTSTKIKELIDSYEYIGWHDTRLSGEKDEYASFVSLDGTSKSAVVNVPAAGEYYVVFMTGPESLEKNPTISSYWQFFSLSGIKLDPVENTEYEAAKATVDALVNVNPGNGKEIATTIESAEVKAVAADINGNAISNSAIIPSETVAVGSSYKADAPEIDGYKFLYWAKGIGKNRKVVSHDESYSFKVTSGGTLLMAVYAKNESANDVAMFYNGNGQLLATQTGTYNTPALPSMAGFGKATHWTLAGSGEEFAAGASGEISGEMSFVAQYGELETVTITATNGKGGGNVAYGSTVMVTASDRNGKDVFAYWENENGEILSFDLSYTFKALRDTTVKAVYGEYNPNKTAIKKVVVTKDGKNVFAEFIGIGDVIERGILFGENASLGNYTAKVTMNTDSDVFTAYNDLEDEPKAIGYAILAGGKVIYSK